MKISSYTKTKLLIIIPAILLICCIVYIILMTPPTEEKPVLTVYTYMFNETSKYKLTELTLHNKVLCRWLDKYFDGGTTCGIPFAFICPDTKIVVRTDGKRHLLYGGSRNYHNTADTFTAQHGIEKSFENEAVVTWNGYGNLIEGDTLGETFNIYADIYSSKDPENITLIMSLILELTTAEMPEDTQHLGAVGIWYTVEMTSFIDYWQ